jgi:transposase-like protein
MIKELSMKYSISSVSRAFSISRSLIYSYLREEEREMERMDRVRKKYKGLKLKFDELCREFPRDSGMVFFFIWFSKRGD